MSKGRLLDALVEAGVKITAPRALICETLEASKDHPSAQQLFERAVLIDAKLCRASLYRTLKLLQELRLVTKHEFKGEVPRYEVRKLQKHDHLIDTKTGQVIEFHDPEIEALKARIAERFGFDIEEHTLELYGHAVSDTSGSDDKAVHLDSHGRLTRMQRIRMKLGAHIA